MQNATTTTGKTAAAGAAEDVRPIPLRAATRRAQVGAKAATLAELLARGATVPDGWVIPVEACALVDREVPAGLREHVARVLDELGEGPVAVRSSAVAEDGADRSYAGQMHTELSVSGLDEVCAAIARCARSATEGPASTYRDALGPGDDGSMAVIVQRMVPAEAAGVAFGANPATGDPEILVDAVPGLGDRLVSGEVSPESWVVRGDEVRCDGTANVLCPSRARRVAELVEELGELLGGPQDVEWALAGGEVHVLQSRPITALPVEPDLPDPPPGTWTRDEVHYPSPMTAFGGSTYLPTLEHGIATGASEFGLLVEGVRQLWRSGEVYGQPIPPGGKDGAPPPWWVLAVLSRVVPPIRARMKAAERALAPGRLEALVDDWESRGRADFERAVRELDAVDLDALDDGALLSHLDEALALLRRGQEVHFRLFFPWLVTTHRFVTTCRELLGWDDGRALALLAGCSATSSAPGRELDAIADAIRERGLSDRCLEAADPVAVLREIEPDLADRLEDWLHRWGLRSSGYDTGAPTLSEQPGLMEGALREALSNEERHDAHGPMEEARSALGSSGDRERFEAVLAEARHVFPLREDNVLYTDNLPCGLARRAALAIGRRLVDRGALQRPRDAVELKLDELRGALREGVDRSSLARRRRAERAWMAAHPSPSSLGPEPQPPPDMRGLPRAGRRVNDAFMWAMSLEYPQMTGGTADVTEDGAELSGVGAWPGHHEGIVRVVRGEDDLGRVRHGDVLVATITTPAWSVVFPRIGALVTDTGGVLSHAAIVAREHGIPTVLNTGGATRELRDGQRVRVDGSRGTVIPLE